MAERKEAKGYRVLREAPELHKLIPPQRTAFPILPDVTREDSWKLIDAVTSTFGLDDYVGCTTQEMWRRPIPHVAQRTGLEALITLYKEWSDTLFEWIFSQVAPPVQTYEKRSAMGFPVNERRDDKLNVLRPFFARFMTGNLSAAEGGYIRCNIRLQPEKINKERVFNFLDNKGSPYSETVSGKERLLRRNSRYASRTRLVFNPPIVNLFKQVLDSAIHNVFLKHHAYHHDMTKMVRKRPKGFVIAVDVKHFERAVGAMVLERARAIGGLYERMQQLIQSSPYLAPSDDRKKAFLVIPNRDAGYVEQLGSGDSSVAPIAKEVLTVLYAEFFFRKRKCTRKEALAYAVSGGTDDVHFLNYGDDNVLYGDESKVKELFAFLSSYLSVEEEIPPKFLGYVLFPEGFMLSISSYILNFYLNERAPYSFFRPYPHLGIVLRRNVYQVQGEPRISEEVIPWEGREWPKYGLNDEMLMRKASDESRYAARLGYIEDPRVVLEKYYQLTEDEKARYKEVFSVLERTETAKMIKSLIGKQWKVNF